MPRRVTLLRVLVALLAALLALFWGALLASPASLWHWEYRRWLAAPAWPLAQLALAVALCVAGPGRLPRAAFHALLVAVLAWMHATSSVVCLGDHDYWRSVGPGTLRRSEILANLVFAVCRGRGLDAGWVPVISGMLSGFLLLRLADELAENSPAPEDARRLAPLLYVGSALPGLFFRDFIETTQVSTPLLVLFIGAGLRYVRGGAPWIVVAATSWTLAAMTHGENCFLAPALPALIAIRRPARGVAAGELAAALAAVAATYCLVITALSAAGFTLVPGNGIWGFVPLCGPLSRFQDYTMFSRDHAAYVGNLLLVAAPAAVLVLAPACVRLWRAPEVPAEAELLFLTVLSLGYVGFVFLWSFDLGFPTDYDLMFSMSVPLVLWTTKVAADLCPRPVRLAGVAFAFLTAWPVILLCLKC